VARVGGALWLIKHEARMFFYNATFGVMGKQAKRQIGGASMTFWVVIAVLAHVAAFALVYQFRTAEFSPSQPLIMGATAGVFVVLTLMLSSALRVSVEALFERGDLDLLLSSPMSSRTIFSARFAGIVLGVASIYLLVFGPFANAGLMLGQFQWLGIYPAVISFSVFAASLGMLLTLALVRWIGARRTRVVAQILGALSGAFFFLLSQAGNSLLVPLRARAMQSIEPLLAPGAVFGPDSLVWLPGRALLGSAGPLVVLVMAGVALFFATVHFTHAFFVHGLAQSVSVVSVASRPRGTPRFKFQRNLTRIIVIKEWRLIARDTHLISQVLLQLLYMLPMMLVLFTKGSVAVAGIGAALVFLCSQLASSLSWIVLSAEDAPDLLQSAPCAQSTVRRAKLIAIAAPVLVLMAAPALWTVWRAPLAGFALVACATGATICAALNVLWTGRPASRGDFKSRARGNFMSGFFELLGAVAWTGCAFSILTALAGEAASYSWLIGALAAAGAALTLCLGSWVLRNRPV